MLKINNEADIGKELTMIKKSAYVPLKAYNRIVAGSEEWVIKGLFNFTLYSMFEDKV